MMLSSLLLTVMCYILLVTTAKGVDLSSSRTTVAQMEAAYKISGSKASAEYDAPLGAKGPGAKGPVASIPYTPQCSSGPVNKIYSKPGYFYYPPITTRQCDGLSCSHPGKCVPSRTRVFYRWVLVYKCTNYGCHYEGCKYLRFSEHLSCRCTECGHNSHCTAPKTCNKYTWTCQCPASGTCLSGYTWDRIKCICVPCRCPGCPFKYYDQSADQFQLQ